MQANKLPCFSASVILWTVATSSWAGCGAAVCTFNTNWASQGVWTQEGWRADLRFEYIDQAQPRAGSRTVAVGEIPAHHDEVRTINRNWIAALDYTANANWGVSVQVPWTDRDHRHIHNHHGTQHPETWRFEAPGDIRLLGRYQRDYSALATHGVSFGLKLPTGATDERNVDGDLAERSLQPGTGTSDIILGYFANHPLRIADKQATGFVQLQVQSALAEHDSYKPGTQYSLDGGLRYPLGTHWSTQLQANLVVRERDAGSEAEPDNTGGTFLWLSPGVGFNMRDDLQLYGFVQWPLYQYVNGVQLTADYTLAVGASWRY